RARAEARSALAQLIGSRLTPFSVEHPAEHRAIGVAHFRGFIAFPAWILAGSANEERSAVAGDIERIVVGSDGGDAVGDAAIGGGVALHADKNGAPILSGETDLTRARRL